MNGFNPDIKVSVDGEAQVVSPEAKEPTIKSKIEGLSDTERAELLQDALEKYNELEQLIHAITSTQPELQDTLF